MTKPTTNEAAISPTPEQSAEAASSQNASTYGTAAFLECRDLSLSILRKPIFENVSFSAQPGEVIAIRGHHGSGKTSVLLCLAGRMKISGGTVKLGALELPRDMRRVQRIAALGIFEKLNMPQEPLEVWRAVRAELEIHDKPHKKSDALEYLTEWKIQRMADEKVGELTAYYLAILGLALAFIGQPKLVVMDDIEDSLTLEQSLRLMEILKERTQRHQAVIAVGVTERSLAESADQALYLAAKEGDE